MSSRKGRGTVRHSVRVRPGLDRGKSWEDPEKMMDVEPKRQASLKHCCRSVATFMCTQVGVGGIIVCYALVGASLFMALETHDNPWTDIVLDGVTRSRNQTSLKLLDDLMTHPFNEAEWNHAADFTLHEFQRQVVEAVKKGYDGRTAKEQWNFPAALMFTLSIFTMIGFGNLVPRTDWGKVITICYAVLGIPLYILYFMNMGKALASTFKWLYIKLNSCTLGGAPVEEDHTYRGRHDDDEEDEPVIVPSSASLYVLMCYICVGTIMFAEWENWDYLDSVYFCVTSLCKIGLGDFVPGTNIDESEEGNQTKLVINFVYLLLGLGLVAMCYNLLKEEVLAKLKQIKTDLRDFCGNNLMSYLESLERKLRNMSENGTSGEIAANSLNVGGCDVVSDLRIPRKFVRVLGYDGRCNDLVYCKPLVPCEEEEISVDSDSNPPGMEESRQKLLIFFGGDMQDFPEIMEQHKEHRNYSGWNLEATAQILQKQFPSHHVVVVRPSRIQIMTFSCYDNFVHCNHTGVPDHVITHGSLQHLESLLRNLSERVEKSQKQDQLLAKQIAEESKEEGNESEVSSTTPEESSAGQNGNSATSLEEESEAAKVTNPHLDRSRISLAGFSKGCVVLNQFLYEFHYLKTLTPDDSTMDAFVHCIEDMYWLDGGHNGGKNTWITSRSLLETLTRHDIRVHVHMTPYQLTDDRRPWIRKEERMFTDWLKRFSAPVKRYIHFENEPASLLQHFRLIAEFGTAEKEMEPDDSSDDLQNEPSQVGVLSM